MQIAPIRKCCAEKNRKGDIGGGVGNRDPPKLANGLFVLHRGLMRIAEARECKREKERFNHKKATTRREALKVFVSGCCSTLPCQIQWCPD